MTSDHVRILKRYADEAVVIFDGDKAGEQASLRSLDIFLEEDMAVKVLSMPAGEDPDSFIQHQGCQAMLELLKSAQDVFDFKLQVLSKRFKRSDSLGLMRLSREFLEMFSKMRNSVLLDRYMKRLALELGVQETSLRSELQKIKGKTPMEKKGVSEVQTNEKIIEDPKRQKTPDESIEHTLVSLFLQYPAYIKMFRLQFPQYEFSGADAGALMKLLETWMAEKHEAEYKVSQLMPRISEPELQSFAARLVQIHWDSEADRDTAVNDCMNKLLDIKRHKELEQLKLNIERAEAGGDEKQVLAALKAYQSFLGGHPR